MITRLNNNSFFVKGLDFMKYGFSFFENRSIKLLKFRRMATYCPDEGKHCFVKFNQFLANWSFLLKKWKNSIEDRCKRSRTQSPCQLIAVVNITTSVDEMDLSSKSFKKPFENWGFGIIALKQNFIEKVIAVFRSVSIYTKRAFSVYKPSKIGIILERRFNCISATFKFCLHARTDKILECLLIGNHINAGCLLIEGGEIKKSGVQESFNSFLHEKWNEVLDELQRFLSSYAKMVSRFMSLVDLFQKDRSSELFFEPFHSQFFCGNDNKGGCKFVTIFNGLFSNMKASIPVNISSSVSKIGRFNHTMNDSWLDYLSQQVIVLDNPTNLGVSDFSLVAATLDTNNRMSVVVKSWVIDLELPCGQQGASVMAA